MLNHALPIVLLIALAAASATGCWYGGGAHETPADFGELGMHSLQAGDGRHFMLPQQQTSRPRAQLPTSLAVARVQYHSAYGVRDETWHLGSLDLDAKQMARLDALVDIADVVEPRPQFTSTRDRNLLNGLRRGALAEGAELLLLYTFEGSATTSGGIVPLDLLSLGTLPTVAAEAHIRAHALLIDAASGYVYAHAESDEESWQLANHWTDSDAARDTINRAQRRAFDRLLVAFEPMWWRLRAVYWSR
ncbi:MAG: hypothetical protein ACR2GY_11715 [Phycisphaerales bacterium]